MDLRKILETNCWGMGLGHGLGAGARGICLGHEMVHGHMAGFIRHAAWAWGMRVERLQRLQAYDKLEFA